MSSTSVDSAPALRGRCSCEYCELGLTTAQHADASHDQRLVQDFALGAAGPATLRIVGGTTKCARLMLAYALEHPEDFAGKRVLELGAGAGLVAIGLAVALGCQVDATDQEPVLDLLGANIADNTDPSRHAIRASALQWGEDLERWRNHTLVIGADLNFARENLEPLRATLDALVSRPDQALVLASIRRAKWEDALFRWLDDAFDGVLLADAGDVLLHRYVRHVRHVRHAGPATAP